MIKIYNFNSSNIEKGKTRVTYISEAASKTKRVASCFEAYPSNYIFCFFVDNNNFFRVNVYKPNFSIEKLITGDIDIASSNDGNEYIFMKALHLTENSAIFIYYKSILDTYPIIQIKQLDENFQLNNFKSYGQIQLNKYDFHPNLFLNDIIKIKSNQIYFSSISQNKEILYIVNFHFYNKFDKFVIRYYIIKIYELYGKKNY